MRSDITTPRNYSECWRDESEKLPVRLHYDYEGIEKALENYSDLTETQKLFATKEASGYLKSSHSSRQMTNYFATTVCTRGEFAEILGLNEYGAIISANVGYPEPRPMLEGVGQMIKNFFARRRLGARLG